MSWVEDMPALDAADLATAGDTHDRFFAGNFNTAADDGWLEFLHAGRGQETIPVADNLAPIDGSDFGPADGLIDTTQSMAETALGNADVDQVFAELGVLHSNLTSLVSSLL